ncbi:Phosphomannomutase/phosphoglucomutase [Pontiella desulfatans]|uniref:Phosphomannomutase/phosphoglucomutase n=1 Tax=Pontiella desulfatans TaxID=2750659 RepID=A0A6C2U5B4_PONDE|nr:phosphomannomutase/phosphoglucomutase [Pontiella desulfatans]VGO15095.1 Phosphomannomutase/phosphoglucomutase [Pontiella desulfatans]
MAGIFKAYDIRGIYGTDLTDEIAFKIGRAVATFLKPKKFVIGHDMRPHSTPLFEAMAKGLTMQGVDVINIGLVSTPMCYHANGKLGADGSAIITASHNPGEWNGMKICREQAIPISEATGIADIERIVNKESFDALSSVPGTVITYDIKPDYFAHIRAFANIKKSLNVVIDYANGMGILEGKTFTDAMFNITPMYDELNGTFPNHEANPLDLETLEDLSAKLKKGRYDFGIAFDGDADRAGFLDENGNNVSMDIITALIAQALLEKFPGSTILYDLRSTWAAREVIEEAGGNAMMSRVGHAFIKAQMREADAVFAGELSGHYYFRDNYYTESSALAALCVANLISETGKTLSELIRPIRRYFASGEINSKVADVSAVFERLNKKYGDADKLKLDGTTYSHTDWWFNVRTSNTEPLVRLNLEAKTASQMAAKRDEVLALIRA